MFLFITVLLIFFTDFLLDFLRLLPGTVIHDFKTQPLDKQARAFVIYHQGTFSHVAFSQVFPIGNVPPFGSPYSPVIFGDSEVFAQCHSFHLSVYLW